MPEGAIPAGRRATAGGIPVHPVLFALLSVVSVIAANISETGPQDMLRSIVAGVAAAVILWAGLTLVYGDVHRGAAVASIALILFFSYGHVYHGLVSPISRPLFERTGLVGRHPALLVVWGGLLALGTFAASRIQAQRGMMTAALNLASVAGLAVPLVQTAGYEVNYHRPVDRAPTAPVVSGATERPDIYYILLDGYGRDDVLRDLYDHDNHELLGFLESHGFFVASEASSNYMQTSLSVASSLNMTHLGFLDTPDADAPQDRQALARLIRFNTAQRLLKDLGYRSVVFSSGYRVTELLADEVLTPPVGPVNPFEALLIQTTAATALADLARTSGWEAEALGFAAYRDRIEFTLAGLPVQAATRGPKFVFVHLTVPHPPFVFGPDGEAVPQTHHYSFRDGDAFFGTEADYVRKYRDQVAFVDRVVREALAELLARSETAPVILLQSDHGPGSRLRWDSFEATDLRERFGILSAYRLPDSAAAALYPSISPVNSFRVVFNGLFGTQLALEPDRSYFSSWDRPYRLTPVPPEAVSRND